MASTELTATDFRRIAEITKKLGYNKGKGYSVDAVRAALQRKNRPNLKIEAVAKDYIQRIQSLTDETELDEKKVREIVRQEAKNLIIEAVKESSLK